MLAISLRRILLPTYTGDSGIAALGGVDPRGRVSAGLRYGQAAAQGNGRLSVSSGQVPLRSDEIGSFFARALDEKTAIRRPWYEPSESLPGRAPVAETMLDEYNTLLSPPTQPLLSPPLAEGANVCDDGAGSMKPLHETQTRLPAQSSPGEWAKLIRKLRWIGLEDEAGRCSSR